jgi:four helix bundle protein
MKHYDRDIKEWTKQFAISTVKLVIELKREGIEFALRDQLLRSGGSIGANVNEARASSSRKEMVRYYEIALKSADETSYWIDVICGGYSLDLKKFEFISRELTQIKKVIASIIINLKKNSD